MIKKTNPARKGRLDTGYPKRNSPDESRERIKQVSDSGETVVLVPPVLEPVEIEVALVAVPVEVWNVAVAVEMPPD